MEVPGADMIVAINMNNITIIAMAILIEPIMIPAIAIPFLGYPAFLVSLRLMIPNIKPNKLMPSKDVTKLAMANPSPGF